LKKAIVIQLVILLLIGMMLTAGCSSEGYLPTLERHNQWVYSAVSHGTESTWTLTITREATVLGKECYIAGVSIDPPLQGIYSITLAMEKATCCPVTMEASGMIPGVSSVLSESTCSYTFPEQPYWPLAVGKESTMVEKITTVTTAMGETDTQTKTETYTCKVEKMEDVTVPAGTFKCFKLVQYDEAGKKVSVSWHSDEVRNDVKVIEYDTGMTMELESYSV